ncbi:hypothetical protein DSO57_1008985, partial [Entomophthora muscae]
GDGCRESSSSEPEPPPTKVSSSEGIFAVLSSPVPGTKVPPRRSGRLQARRALAQAISTTIENPMAKLYLLWKLESDNTDPHDDSGVPVHQSPNVSWIVARDQLEGVVIL